MVTKKLQYNRILSEASPEEVSFKPHFHEEYELEFVFNVKSAELILGRSRYEIKPDTLILCIPPVVHNLKFEENQPFERTVIRFNGEFLGDDLTAALKNAPPIYDFSGNNPVKELFYQLKECESLFSQEEFAAVCEHYVKIILARLKYCSPETKKTQGGTSNEVINHVLRYIDDNVTKPLKSESVAKEFFVSSSWLLHKFKEETGVSFKKYVNKKKLIYVDELIKSGLPVSKAAESCSYDSYTTFFRQYKKYMKKSPAETKSENTNKKVAPPENWLI